MRIGVLSDTHVPDRTLDLPAEILEIFAGVDMILHAGDISEPSVLARLQAVAPVVAVQGNRDEALADLPLSRIVLASGWRIGLIHGMRPRRDELPDRLRYLGGDHRFIGQRSYLLQSFAGANVQCIIFGHSHQACQMVQGGVLLLNPGGVVPSPGGGPSSVAILELDSAGIRPRLIPLRYPPRRYTVGEEIKRGVAGTKER